MAGILNNSARPITLNCRIGKTKKLIKHRLNPMEFKSIPDGEWHLLKKNPVVQGWIDRGDLAVGKKVKPQLPDDFEPEEDGSEEGSSEEGGEEGED